MPELYKNKYRISSARLPQWDYSMAGFYFMTICTYMREPLLGMVVGGDIQLTPLGKIVRDEWEKSFLIRPELICDNYVIMPNHMHGIVNIVGAIPRNRPIKNDINHNHQGENMVSPLPISNLYRGLGRYLSWFKRMTTNAYIRNVETNNWPMFDRRLWQRSFYDHVIRDEQSLRAVRGYIADNPLNWQFDEENVEDGELVTKCNRLK